MEYELRDEFFLYLRGSLSTVGSGGLRVGWQGRYFEINLDAIPTTKYISSSNNQIYSTVVLFFTMFLLSFSTDKCSLIKNLLKWYSDPDSALDSLFRSITNFTYVCNSRSLYRKDVHSIVVCVWCCIFVFFREFVCR